VTVVNVTPPVVSGETHSGGTLTTTDGTWTFDLDHLEFSYEWLRCDGSGLNCAVIPGRDTDTLVLGPGDIGSTFKARVTAVETADPVPPDPSGDPKLRWAPPSLSSPTVRALTNSARSVPVGSNQDLRITALTQDLTGSIGQVEGYNDVEAIAGRIQSSEQNEGHIIPRQDSGTFHLEGWDIFLSGAADAITVRWICKILQIEACRIQVTTAGTSHHSDGFQTQEAIIDDLRMDRVTIITNYQGIFLSNEPQNAGPARSKVAHQTLSRILFKPNGSAPSTYFFKAFPPRPNTDPIGPTEMYDVWMPAASAVGKVYPQWSSWDGGDVGDYYGAFVTTKVHPVKGTWPFLRFSVTGDTVPTGSKSGQPARDCGVRGDGGIWLYNSLADVPSDVGAPSDVGRGFTSPGYL